MVKLLRGAAILTAVCGLAWAQAKPNFSGEWRMNPDKTDYGTMAKPEKMTRKIEHTDPDLRIVSTQSGPRGEIRSELKLVIDGKEQVVRVGNIEIKTTPHWDGAVLRIDSKRPFQTGEILMQERWTLAEDGKSLTIATHIVAPKGEANITLVLDKQ